MTDAQYQTGGGGSGSPTTVTDKAGINAPLQDGAGHNLVNIPAWQTATVYPQGYVVQQAGVAYMATATFTSGASFAADGANWAPLSSAELAYAQITANFATTSTSYVNVTGLAISVVTNGRPFMVRALGTIWNSTAGAFSGVQILRTSDSVIIANTIAGSGSANEQWPIVVECRQSLAAGTYAYQLQVASSAVGNTATFKAGTGATSPAFIQAVQI